MTSFAADVVVTVFDLEQEDARPSAGPRVSRCSLPNSGPSTLGSKPCCLALASPGSVVTPPGLTLIAGASKAVLRAG